VAYKESARVKLALKRPREALGDASIAAALTEGDAEAQKLVHEAGIARGLAYLDKNQVSNAVYELTLYRDEHPDVAEAHLGLCQAYVAQRSLDEAFASFEKALELDPGLAEAHYQIGYMQHMLKKDPSGALPSCEKAVEAAPDNLEYRTELGAVLSELELYDRAIEQLQQVVASPAYASADAWLYLGAAQLAAQRYQEAIPALEKVLAVDPESVQAEAYLAWCYFGTKDSEQFVRHAERARSLGYKDATLDQYLERVKGGEEIR
jgi:tetratricopeptide (TPR) repeat protein